MQEQNMRRDCAQISAQVSCISLLSSPAPLFRRVFVSSNWHRIETARIFYPLCATRKSIIQRPPDYSLRV